jgi:hypothetical protein
VTQLFHIRQIVEFGMIQHQVCRNVWVMASTGYFRSTVSSLVQSIDLHRRYSTCVAGTKAQKLCINFVFSFEALYS